MKMLHNMNIRNTLRPVKILQFGEGNFLRAFVCDMIDRLNSTVDFNGDIAILKPRPSGDLSKFRSQGCVYTVLTRGIQNQDIVDDSRIITSVKEILSTTDDYLQYMDYAESPDIEFIISNTTEAGIAIDENDKLFMTPPISFPAKLTQFLWKRYSFFQGDETKGITFLPVELIDNNGFALKNCIVKTAKKWELPTMFINWIDSSCIFCNTLVDRIVTGFPEKDYSVLAKKLGYQDQLMVSAEPFSQWVIESSDDTLPERLPLIKAGLPVIFTHDCKPYRRRKVRILNGAHTSFSLAAYLCDIDFVREAIEDPYILKFIKHVIFEEIIPSLDMDKQELYSFADSVIERFQNPFIDHQLLSIALNSVSKWKTRCMPSLLDYYQRYHQIPKCLSFSLAALLDFYCGDALVDGKMHCQRHGREYYVSDAPDVLSFFVLHHNDTPKELVQEFLTCEKFLGEDLTKIPQFTDMVSDYLTLINEEGMKAAMKQISGENFMVIHPSDNVAISLSNENKDIAMGHKKALKDISKGEEITKYGYPIGISTQSIPLGSHVHTHNMITGLSDIINYQYQPVSIKDYPEQKGKPNTFLGYPRKYGNAGIRNHIFIIPTVGCMNKVARHICDLAKQKIIDTPNVDDIICFEHPYGCSQLGDDQNNTQKILADLCTHPNAAGVLLLGLGCENSSIKEIQKYMPDFDEKRISFLTAQDVDDEVGEALSLVESLVYQASLDKRIEIPVSQLVIGLKCGGSDGLSGITANPLVGRLSDCLISQGGSAVLTEVPEMFGAEQILMNRCRDKNTFEKLKTMINDFKAYYISQGQNIYENPSPGNKAGGISTLEEKSLGCIQKSGTSKVCDVLSYGKKVSKPGLSLLNAPGNDLVASTALAASGAQLILFTTGRGTPFSAPVPTLKISSNTPLFKKKSHWIDFDAGEILSGSNIDILTDMLFQLLIEVASGKKVNSETAGLYDMAIFKSGVTL